jgi:uncharacterized protein YkwD
MKNMNIFKRITAAAIALVLSLSMAKADTALAAENVSGTTVSVPVKYGQTEARTMLSMINSMRTTSSRAWAYTKAGTKEYYSNLKPLTYDYRLEEIAMQRAAEISVTFDHERPCGKNVFDLTAAYGYNCAASENLAAGYQTASIAFNELAEDSCSYNDQGHRRNMLSSKYTAVGIGHCVSNGLHFWVQVFAGANLGQAATPANNSETNVSIKVSGAFASNIVLEGSRGTMNLTSGSTAQIPAVTAKISYEKVWPYKNIQINPSVTWTSSNPSVAAVSGSTVIAKNSGNAVLTGTMLNAKVEIKVQVSASGSLSAESLKPAKASNLRASSSVYGVTLRWNEVPGADGYIIYSRTGNTGSFNYLYMVTKTSFTDLTATSGQWNFYMVFPYYNINGRKVVNTCSDYVFGRKIA